MALISSDRQYSAQELQSLMQSWIVDEKKSAADYQKMYDITRRAEFLQMSNDEHKHAQYLQKMLKDLEAKQNRTPMKWYPSDGPGTDPAKIKPSKVSQGRLLYYVRSRGGYTERIVQNPQGFWLLGDDGEPFDMLAFDTLKQLQDFHHIANSNLRRP